MKSFYFYLVDICLISLLVYFGLLCSVDLGAQEAMIIDDRLEIHNMDVIGASQYMLVRLPDSTLARAVAPFSDVPINEPISLPSGFQNYQVGYNEARIYKYEERVYLQGLIRKTTGNITTNDTIFVLQEAFRPRQRVVAQGRQNANAVRLTMLPTGEVVVQSVTQPVDFVSIDNIHFYRNEILKVGDFHEGGYIFYITPYPQDLDGDGQNDQGLVAATSDLPSSNWGCDTSAIAGTQYLTIGSGAQNTLDIINNCTESGAARMCANLVSNGKDDWFLPSRDELVQINNAIGYNSKANIGNIVVGPYWSSSEDDFYDPKRAYGHNMAETNSSTYYIYIKNTNLRVRAIRAY